MKRILLTAFLSVTCASPLSAQSIWKHFSKPDFGLALYVYNYEEEHKNEYLDSHGKTSLSHLGAIVGFNLPFVPLDDDLSIGLNPSAALAVVNRSSDYYEQTTMISVELPWYATLKWGTDASFKGSSFPLGVTAGIGYHFSHLQGITGNFSESFGTPSLLAEVNFGKRKSWPGLVKLRYTHSLGTHEIDASHGDVVDKLSISRSGFHLIFVLGY
jgi:hypothetical protein